MCNSEKEIFQTKKYDLKIKFEPYATVYVCLKCMQVQRTFNILLFISTNACTFSLNIFQNIIYSCFVFCLVMSILLDITPKNLFLQVILVGSSKILQDGRLSRIQQVDLQDLARSYNFKIFLSSYARRGAWQQIFSSSLLFKHDVVLLFNG